MVGLANLFSNYRYKAKVKKIPFSITKQDFARLTKQNCYICLKAPSSKLRGYVYNGLDRVDSSKGYHLSNVMPCCSECNFMKRVFSLDRFFEKVTELYELHTARNLLLLYLKRKAHGKDSTLDTPRKGNRRRKNP